MPEGELPQEVEGSSAPRDGNPLHALIVRLGNVAQRKEPVQGAMSGGETRGWL